MPSAMCGLCQSNSKRMRRCHPLSAENVNKLHTTRDNLFLVLFVRSNSRIESTNKMTREEDDLNGDEQSGEESEESRTKRVAALVEKRNNIYARSIARYARVEG